MNDRKIKVLVATVIIYCLYVYTIRIWKAVFQEDLKDKADDQPKEVSSYTNENIVKPLPDIKAEADIVKPKTKAGQTKKIPRYFKNACSAFEVFTTKPLRYKARLIKMDDSNNIAVFGSLLFLMILIFTAILDFLTAKEEERVRLTQNPEGERRQSLSEFANKKSLRRESSKFGLQLFQIAETSSNEEEEKQNRRQARAFTRGESTNSYLSERNFEAGRPQESPTMERKLVKRQSVAKLLGSRPAPMVRRCSFPALPLNPDVQALMLGSRRPSADSDDESDKGRRVRIIRRY